MYIEGAKVVSATQYSSLCKVTSIGFYLPFYTFYLVVVFNNAYPVRSAITGYLNYSSILPIAFVERKTTTKKSKRWSQDNSSNEASKSTVLFSGCSDNFCLAIWDKSSRSDRVLPFPPVPSGLVVCQTDLVVGPFGLVVGPSGLCWPTICLAG